MSTVVGPNWLDQHVLPDIRQMLVQDAYFKLMSYARQLTGKFNGAIAGLIYAGYVTSQTVAIRRFCDNRRDVISLRRVLEESKKANTVVEAKADYLPEHRRACRQLHRAHRQSAAPAEHACLAPAGAAVNRRPEGYLRSRHDPCPRPSAEGLRRGDAGRAKRRHDGGFQTVGAGRGYPEAMGILARSPRGREQLALVNLVRIA
jgi:hypothetical protein